MATRKRLTIGGVRVRAGETRDVRLKVSETFTGDPLFLHLRVIRGKRPGPVVFVSAAIHGDEVNGTGIIRELIWGRPLELHMGTLICAPVVNSFGFENYDRYLPDRRDLNRCFPGSADGSLASRLAEVFMREVVSRSDFGIDLHSAAVRRVNYPNVRGDLGNDGVRRLAEAFGCELIVNGKGPEGSLRRAACAAECPTIILEAGEVGKIEPRVLEIGVRGVRNILVMLGMMRGEVERPTWQATIHRTTWVRAELGGLLRFHVAPGDLVEYGQPLATSESIFGEARSSLFAPAGGVVLSMTTHPATKPGEPVCLLALPRRGVRLIRQAIERASANSTHHRMQADLATSISVS